jgi:glutamine synthetase
VTGFVQQHGLWSDEQQRAANELVAQVAKDGLTSIRLSFPDLHGLLRGKTLLADALSGAMEEGCSISSTLLLKDTAHHTVAPIFSEGAGIDNRDLQGGADVVMVPDPSTFRRLPWSPNTGWMLCDLYFADGRPVEISTRRIARSAMSALAAEGFEFVSGLEVEFHVTKLIDPRLSLEDSGQPGSPPSVSLLHQGYAYLTEQRFDSIEPLLDILRRDCQSLGLPLCSMELEFGPSQCEFVFRPGKGIGPADNMILFRNAVKQICRRQGYHATFMCRPQFPNAMSSGWHLHQSLVHRDTGQNAFANPAEGRGLSAVGGQFLAGLLAGAAGATPFTTPTINANADQMVRINDSTDRNRLSTQTMTHPIWLITGSSRGFGRALASAALEAGDSVVATARRTEELAPLVEKYRERVFPVTLDVTDGAQAKAAIEAAVGRFGRIDVLVNNAGYANIAPIETASEEDFRRQFDTNFWGVYNLSKAALPVLKKQRSGTIVQFSSIGGRVGGTAGLGSYQAAKFAVDGLSRVLATETAPFGVRYLTVEPGGFATDWAGASMEIHGIPAEYDSTVGAIARLLRTDAVKAGDPNRAAEILVRLVKRKHLPTHIVLGAGAIELAQDYSNRQIVEVEAWRQVSASADYGQPYPVELPVDGVPRD